MDHMKLFNELVQLLINYGSRIVLRSIHVSELKKAIGDQPISPFLPPRINADLELEVELEALLEC